MDSARVAQVLSELRRRFPLEAQVTSLPADLLGVYRAILSSWQAGEPPSVEIADAASLQCLADHDVIVVEETRVSCYPFSARDTGIRATVGQKSVNAMCAIDALAIPGILRGIGEVSAVCPVCRSGLACTVDAGGRVRSGDERLAIVWPEELAGGSCCGKSLCPQIRYLCSECEAPVGGSPLGLIEGAAVGTAFFAFQRQLLQSPVSVANTVNVD